MDKMMENILRAMLCNARQCWEQGIAAMAAKELGEEALLLALCHDMVVRQNKDGRLCTVEDTITVTDPALGILPLLEAERLTGDFMYSEAAARCIRYLVQGAPRAASGIFFHLMDRAEIWADSAAMTPAPLVRAKHKALGLLQMKGIRKALFLPETGLYAHKWDAAHGVFANESAWATGNGWIAMGTAWMLLELGKDDPEAARCLADFTAHAEAMLRYQTREGLFHNTMDDPNTFIDCAGATMLGYSMALLVEAGFLDESWLAYPRKVWAELTNRVNARGYFEDCPGSPYFDKRGTSTEMQAFALMLGAVLNRL
ncbi:MAG: glycoside hydrolase family 88 protein [Oscillospiraceae bacterium]|jgi:unsaturated rhamnogalacturonyl hydrolase|nr:glycoside hydrolase family 88 protein [Oscillospiraceae bacterium]